MAWAGKNEAALKRLWRDEPALTVCQIAARLEGITSRAVEGKLRRLRGVEDTDILVGDVRRSLYGEFRAAHARAIAAGTPKDVADYIFTTVFGGAS